MYNEAANAETARALARVEASYNEAMSALRRARAEVINANRALEDDIRAGREEASLAGSHLRLQAAHEEVVRATRCREDALDEWHVLRGSPEW